MKHFFFSLCTSAVGCALVLQFPATAIAGSKETVIYSFDNTSGASPYAGLIYVKGTLYGAALAGGASGDGTVFALVRKTGAETVLHSFGGGTDGKLPRATLTAVKSTLYGTTLEGGANGYGTFFSVDPGTGVETVLHAFGSGTDGEYPVASLIDVKGTLYSTTLNGGADGDGTIFCQVEREHRAVIMGAAELRRAIERAFHIDQTRIGNGAIRTAKGMEHRFRAGPRIDRPARRRSFIPSPAARTASTRWTV
ncbi:MAG TPA: choice-of-anchor tandem repeat GloVer-containing protein [Rhizomicrobium sp.]|jgi:uncharacterized repeat protein (TIGR03803 family)|nr:choice-of-anchor tandem repeat GloVer-containing protein [Rhizomicrobium sp.]